MTAKNTSTHSCLHEADLKVLSNTLLKIENTLVHLTSLLESNARLEEASTATKKAITDITTRLRLVELQVATATGSSKWIDRVVALLIGAGVALLFK
ncbi:MAG: hypothetical protein R3Y11_11050 [Pseudomonadota bacterium]